MNIGLALSGGGFRATVYHLGVLARLAEQDLLEKVTYISSVSDPESNAFISKSSLQPQVLIQVVSGSNCKS